MWSSGVQLCRHSISVSLKSPMVCEGSRGTARDRASPFYFPSCTSLSRARARRRGGGGWVGACTGGLGVVPAPAALSAL